jgi:hypothetical protein
MNAWISKMESAFSGSSYALIGTNYGEKNNGMLNITGSILYGNNGYAGRWNTEVTNSANGNANAVSHKKKKSTPLKLL